MAEKNLTPEEIKLQKALGTFPKRYCAGCGKEFFEDELGTYHPKALGVNKGSQGPLCTICATAQFCADYMLAPELEHVRKKVKEQRMREEKLLEILNKLVEVCDPITFEELNTTWTATDQKKLIALEKEHSEVGIKHIDYDKSKPLCTSVAGLIATITDILVDKRLAFTIDDNGFVIGFCWYEKK